MVRDDDDELHDDDELDEKSVQALPSIVLNWAVFIFTIFCFFL